MNMTDKLADTDDEYMRSYLRHTIYEKWRIDVKQLGNETLIQILIYHSCLLTAYPDKEFTVNIKAIGRLYLCKICAYAGCKTQEECEGIETSSRKLIAYFENRISNMLRKHGVKIK